MRSIFFTLCLLSVNPAWASDFGTILERYESNPSTQEGLVYLSYIRGMKDGFLWSSTLTRANFGEQIRNYCFPENLVMTTDNLVQIGKDYLAENPAAYSDHFGLRMVMALEDAFPCN